MLAFLGPELATAVVALVVFGIVGGIVARGIRNRRQGKGGCSCGCSGCSSAGGCPHCEAADQ